MSGKEYKELTSQIDMLKKLILAGSKEVLSIDECATFTSLSVNHIYRLTSQRAIPFYKPMGGKIYFKKKEIENWLLQGRQATDSEIKSQATTYCITHK
ncbi:MAG: helix-turn-helix domain-containing protein [Bacteroidales bacterium]|nr:helix-turn-helix domain-containing protein [Bacteroidales bacterium]